MLPYEKHHHINVKIGHFLNIIIIIDYEEHPGPCECVTKEIRMNAYGKYELAICSCIIVRTVVIEN